MANRLYDQILARLSQRLNPEVFERCMADLLRGAFPGLVPVPGGSDAGMDGAIPDADGEPFPLVCTTAEDVERNLVNSLESFAARFSTSKVALATSQALTAPRRNKLFALARERGFTLIQIIERRGVADRLYWNSRWRKELLDISGNPSALSIVPLTRRPLIDLEPIGREADIRWVEEIRGDSVLIGEPGSGKTFLLYHLMHEGWNGLFLVSACEAEIADAIRDQAPRVVVVDDAHADPGRLVHLVRLRREIGASFAILATTWSGGSERVIEALGAGEAQVRKLELLPRREILEIIEQVGVVADADVLRHLVDQAANKPGLAVTIARLWLQGAWQEIVDGSVLSRTLLGFLGDFVGPESMPVLAAFSLGGKEGMPLETVAEALGLDLVEAYRIAAGLAAGGVLSEVDGEALAVWPRILRSALIREAFFPQTGPKLPFERLLARAPSAESSVEALVLAKEYGAKISDELLRALVMQAGSRRAWQGLTGLSEDDARWVLESYRGDVLDVARAALEVAPRAAIPRLLARAATPAGTRHSGTANAMAVLGKWVREIGLPHKEELARRRLLAKLSTDFLRRKGERAVGVQGICLALSPGVEGARLDPGAGNTVTISWGLLPLPQLREIEVIWDEARTAIHEIDAPSWQHLKRALWDWIYPQYSARSTSVPEETTQFMHSFAAKVLRDLSPLAAGSAGLTSGLKDLAARLGVTLTLEADADFDVLFPSEGEGVEDAARDSARIALEGLVAKWIAAGPREVATRLAEYEREAQRAGKQWSSRKGALGRALAAAVHEPENWLGALLEAEASDLVVQPFLTRVARERREGWDRFLERALAQKQYSWIASEVTLQLEAPSAPLLEKALSLAAQVPQLVETLCSRREVPLPTLRALLLHSSSSIALAASVGEWNASPQGEVRRDVAADWRAAILRATGGDEIVGLRFWLGVILANDPDLAADWLSARLREADDLPGISEDGPFGRAVSALDRERRLRFLEEHEKFHFPPDLVRLLVGKDADTYRYLLTLPGLAERYLEPLEGMPDDAWLELAKLALEAGWDPHEIAAASLSTSHLTVGSGLSYWNKWDEAFARLVEDPREDIGEVGRRGRELVADEVRDANSRERGFALHGLGAR